MAVEKSIDTAKPYSYINFIDNLSSMLKVSPYKQYEEMIVLCIGTDRSTGDCLGPLVGYKLKDLRIENVHIIGSLEQPVHAKNLNEYLKRLQEFNKPFILAVDACLGNFNRIGHINIKEGPLNPGAGLNKKLPPVGHISITGIVNVGGFMESMVLQSTRLNLVMDMAGIIAGGIRHILWKEYEKKHINKLNHISANPYSPLSYQNNLP